MAVDLERHHVVTTPPRAPGLRATLTCDTCGASTDTPLTGASLHRKALLDLSWHRPLVV
jgi:hypothetical protein